MHQALKDVLGDEVNQKGSNITPERLRFDFNYDQAMTPEQIAEVEKIVNEQIQRGLAVTTDKMSVEEAKAKGAIGLFTDKYDDEVSVYWIGDYSFEICGGPHVENTKDMGTFRIKKEQSSGKGIRRIKAVLE
jgi:alanyl-tRNA synthetase